MDPRVSRNVWLKINSLASTGIRAQDFPARSVVTVPTTLSRLLENRVECGMFGPKAGEETGGWRMVRVEEFPGFVLLDSHYSGVLIKSDGVCASRYILSLSSYIPLRMFASECFRQIFVHILKVFCPYYMTSLSYPPHFHPYHYILRRLPVVQLSNLLLFPLRSKDFPLHSLV